MIQATNLAERRKIPKIALVVTTLMLCAIVPVSLVVYPDEPAPQSPSLASGYPVGTWPPLERRLWDLQPLSVNPLLGCTRPNDQSCLLPSLASQSPPRFVVVERGDNLSRIACQYQTTVDDLVRLNNLSSTNLAVGQQLFVPSPGSPVTTSCG